MRVNLPVSGREHEFEAGQTLVSATDLDSRITYCNPAFVAVSGYDAAELLGQPHNIVRHPDMPREAFRDMWATLQEGRPWTQVVKNRRKNGDHYWVLANVTPVVENGRAVGYMSVRSKPTRAQVQEAEALYARMRAEADTGRTRTHLHRGRIEQGGLVAGVARRLRPRVTGRHVAGAWPPGQRTAPTRKEACVPVSRAASWRRSWCAACWARGSMRCSRAAERPSAQRATPSSCCHCCPWPGGCTVPSRFRCGMR